MMVRSLVLAAAGLIAGANAASAQALVYDPAPIVVAQRLRRTSQIAAPSVPSLLATQMVLLGNSDCVTFGRDSTNQIILTAPAIAPFQ